ncbi:hypothetical protein [Halorhabdus salina]|nr:hypothetical protein [Halorhabdus salina]
MAFTVDPGFVVDIAFEFLPLTLVGAVAVWVVLREFGPIRRLHRRLG